jgi:hypothetical protein
VHSVQSERVVGGRKVTIQEFGLTAAILFTADNNPNGIIVRLQKQVRTMRKLAAQWAHDLAEIELNKVTRIESQLEADGHRLPDGQELLTNSRNRLRTCVEHWNNGDYRQAYQEAERVLRPLRILMRAQWEQATKGLDSPVASPYAVSFFTLPRHWRFMSYFRPELTGPNMLADGSFESGQKPLPDGWTVQESRLDAVDLVARRATEEPKDGKLSLLLEVQPQKNTVPPDALERTFLAVQSPPVRLQPGSLVKISGWIRIPKPLIASVDGALIYESIGGEPLGVRLTTTAGWKHFTLYRQVPSSATVTVTLAMTGIGKAYFDDIRVEPIVDASTAQVPPRR